MFLFANRRFFPCKYIIEGRKAPAGVGLSGMRLVPFRLKDSLELAYATSTEVMLRLGTALHTTATPQASGPFHPFSDFTTPAVGESLNSTTTDDIHDRIIH